MTLTQLRYAIMVANSSSMNEAARNLFISQPSLSTAIKELEEEIGVELFRRTNRGISVTSEGEELEKLKRKFRRTYELCNKRLEDNLRLKEQIKELKEKNSMN